MFQIGDQHNQYVIDTRIHSIEFLRSVLESKTILNYFYIKFEKSIKRIILLSYNPEDLIKYSKCLLELKNKKNYSIEIGLRDFEISKFIKNSSARFIYS